MSSRRRISIVGVISRLFMMLVLLCVVFIVFVTTRGFPRWTTDAILARLNQGSTAIETDHLYYNLSRGFILKNARWFVKGRIGPPMLEGDEVSVNIPLARIFSDGNPVRSIRIHGGVYRPEMAGLAGKSGSRRKSSSWHSSFDLELWDTVCQELNLRHVRCRVVGTGREVEVKDIRATIGERHVADEINTRGNAVYNRDSRITTGQFETRLDPKLFMPFFAKKGMNVCTELVTRLEFDAKHPPAASFTFTREPSDEKDGHATLDIEAQAWARNARYCGVSTTRIDFETSMQFGPTESVVTLDPLYVVRPEGAANIALTADGRKRTVVFSGESTLEPRSLARMTGVLTNDWTKMIRLEGAHKIIAEGHVYVDSPEKSRLTATVSGDHLGYKRLLSDRYRFRLTHKGYTNTFDEIQATVCDGALTGTATVVANPISEDVPHYTFRGDLNEANFSSIVTLWRGEADDNYSGSFSLRLNVSGPIGKTHNEKVSGTSRIRVREGRVFRLPIFGGLSELLSKLIPGMDFVLRQSELDADIVVGGGKLHSDRISIDGDVFSMSGHGNYSFDKSVDFLVQIKLMKSDPFFAKIVRFITWPITKLLEFRLEGTVDEPRWYAVNFSSELLEKLRLKKSRKEKSADNEEELEPDVGQ